MKFRFPSCDVFCNTVLAPLEVSKDVMNSPHSLQFLKDIRTYFVLSSLEPSSVIASSRAAEGAVAWSPMLFGHQHQCSSSNSRACSDTKVTVITHSSPVWSLLLQSTVSVLFLLLLLLFTVLLAHTVMIVTAVGVDKKVALIILRVALLLIFLCCL